MLGSVVTSGVGSGSVETWKIFCSFRFWILGFLAAFFIKGTPYKANCRIVQCKKLLGACGRVFCILNACSRK